MLSVVAFGAVLVLDLPMASETARPGADATRLGDREKRRLWHRDTRQAQPALRRGARQPPACPGISMNEFADLSDGQRAILRTDRGWSPIILGVTTCESLVRDARIYLEFEDDQCCPISLASIVDRLWRKHAIRVEPESVNAALLLPRRIELDDHLIQHLESL